ncbi:MAG: hypothetical protein DHS20C07_08650 [Methyloligella sp.]|nr:MAG: hypothetical protein DHS20C07_08650 [Methyloligella sp.]
MSVADVQKEKSHDLGEEQSIWFKLTPLLKGANPMQVVMHMCEKYGGVIPINLKDQKLWFMSDVEHFRRVLVTNADNYTKYFDGIRPIFGDSMITVDGNLWQNIRTPQQPAFHPKAFDNYFPFLVEAINAKCDRFSELAKSGETVEMVEETWTLAADMVCRALFDRKMPFNPHFVFKAVKTYTDVSSHKSIRLGRQSGELKDISEVDPAKAVETWLSVPEMVLGEDPLTTREHTLMAMLMNAKNDENIPDFDENQVIDELKQYLWAGTETTALTLAWTFYIASQHEDVREKILAEAEEVYGGREPTIEDIQKLTYTKNVAQETLRMFPPIWALIRVAQEDDVIEGHEIKAGDKMVMCTYAAHHSSKYWNNPEEFDPDRFSPDRMKRRVKYSYLPFGAGKRSCIGGQFSFLEICLALPTLLKRFQPEYIGDPIQLNATVTLTPKGGLPFRITERKS